MRKLKKRLAALGVGLAVMAASAMSLSALAWELDPVWPATYTPYTGKFYANTTAVQVYELRWSQRQLTNTLNAYIGKLGVEFEFQPSVDDTHLVWSNSTSKQSNIPSVYYEFQDDDPDDVAICAGDLSKCEAETSYYGIMYMQKNPNFSGSNTRYIFESELNQYIPIASDIINDYWPLRGNQYNLAPTYFGSNYSWLN